MTTTFNFELFKKRLNLFLEKIEDLGGATEPLAIEKPATEEEVKAIEEQLGYTLPPHFREVLLENTAHLEFYWDVNDVTINLKNDSYQKIYKMLESALSEVNTEKNITPYGIIEKIDQTSKNENVEVKYTHLKRTGEISLNEVKNEYEKTDYNKDMEL